MPVYIKALGAQERHPAQRIQSSAAQAVQPDNRPQAVQQLRLQQAATAGTRSPQVAVGATAQRVVAEQSPIQRAVRKPGSLECYKRAPASLDVKYRAIFQDMINKNAKHPKTGKNYTYAQALAEVKKRFNAQGRYVTGRPGTRIPDAKRMVRYLKHKRNADVRTIKDKFNRGMGPIIDVIFSTIEVMHEDFSKVVVSGAASTVHTNTIGTLTSFVPQLIRTGSAFNFVADEMVKQGGGLASSLKGSMFEDWALHHVLSHAKGRVSFKKQGNMACARSSDGFDATTGTLWDMKHYYASNVPSDQADDYSEILKNGYTSKEGHKVKRVNYLFPTEDGAKYNDWLSSTYGFGIYYVDGTTIKKHL